MSILYKTITEQLNVLGTIYMLTLNISLISYRNCLIFEVIGGNPITIIGYLLSNNIQLHLKLQITCRKNTILGTLLTPRPIS